MRISAAHQTESFIVFHTNPWRSHFLLFPSLGPGLIFQMVPGPSSVLLVTETVSYPTIIYMTVTIEREDLVGAYPTSVVLPAPLCSDLSAQICLGQLPAGMLLTSLPNVCVAPGPLLRCSPWRLPSEGAFQWDLSALCLSLFSHLLRGKLGCVHTSVVQYGRYHEVLRALGMLYSP